MTMAEVTPWITTLDIRYVAARLVARVAETLDRSLFTVPDLDDTRLHNRTDKVHCGSIPF